MQINTVREAPGFAVARHICQSVHKCLPQKFVKFNKHKHKKSKWITNEIVRSMASRDRLYAKLKRN